TADKFWPTFKLALAPHRSAKIREIALDSLQKLIAHRLLRGDLPLPSLQPAQPSSSLFSLSRRSSQGENDLSSLDSSLLDIPSEHARQASSTSIVSAASQQLFLIDDIIHTVCTTFVGSTTEDAVQLQILKVLLTAVTSTACEIHEISLLKVIKTCFNIHLYSKNSTNAATAKASLTQMVNLVFSRMERYAGVLNKSLGIGNGGTKSTIAVLQIEDSSLKVSSSLDDIEFVKETEIVKVVDHLISDVGNDLDVNYEEIKEEKSQEIKEYVESKENNDIEEYDKSEENNEIIDYDKSEENNEIIDYDNSKEKNEIKEDQDIKKNNESLVSVSDQSTEKPPTVPQPTNNIETENNPYDPTIPFYNRLLRKDVYLVFRLLCRLSIHSDSTNLQSGTFNAASIKETNVMDELSHLATKARLLALEMILSVLNNSGPVFQTDDLYITLMKQHLCLSISRNAVTSNPMLFELSLSTFLMVIRTYRAHLKTEIEVLLITVYIHILEMGNSSYRQKSMVLQGILKICEDPQTLADLFLNYDCDIAMASLFERVVGACVKIAQGKDVVIPTSSGVLGFGGDSKAELMRAQDRRLKVRGLCCLVAIVNSLVEWSREVAPEIPVITATLAVNSPNMAPRKTRSTDTRSFEVTRVSTSSASTAKSFLEALAPTAGTPVVLVRHPLHSVSMSHDPQFTHSNGSIASTSFLSTPTDDDSTQIEELKSRKVLLSQRIKYFNEKPEKAITQLINDGFIAETPDAIATFLRTTPELDKAAIGDYIGSNDPLALKSMHAFIDALNFTSLDFVSALRLFLQTFRLPGESQKIDRLMEKFADRFCENNPDVFAKADMAYQMAFSVIMLNTDLHSSQIKHRMDKAAFFKNNRGVCDDHAFLTTIFDEIAVNEIILEEEHAGSITKMAIGWGAGELNDRERMEAYKKEIAVIQKKSQQMMREAVAHRAAAPFRPATNVDLARLMFVVIAWPLMAAFSLRLEAAADDEEDEVGGKKGSTEPKTVDLCLQGLAGSIRLASIFRLETERDAFVTSLSKLTGLHNLSTIKSKNVKVIKTMMALANSLGEHLEGGWVHVLRTVSLIERLQIVANRSAFDSAAALVSEKSQRRSSELKRISVEPSSFMFGLFSETKKAVVRTSIGDSSEFEAFGKLGPGLEKLVSELQGQNIVVAIDRVFSNSVNLSATAIIHFFKALCQASLEEIGLDSMTQIAVPTAPATNTTTATSTTMMTTPLTAASAGMPRMYLLQKLVEIAYYNMPRIRFEWSQIWKLIQPHFNTVGCHSNTGVAIFAVDSLRQLSMKLLEREELAHYSTQNEFMKSFEWIMRYNTHVGIRELVLQSVEQMIAARARSIKSGWKSILVVLTRVTDGLDEDGSEEEAKLVIKAFAVVQNLFAKHFEMMVSAGAFVDLVNCLVEFAVLDGVGYLYDEVVVGAIQLLQKCTNYLIQQAVEEEVNIATRSEPVELAHVSMSSQHLSAVQLPRTPYMLPNGIVSEDHFYLKWFPILSAFSRVVVDSHSLAIRTRALDTLYDTLKLSGRLFDVEYWKSIHRSVVFPIFEDLRDAGGDPRESVAVSRSRVSGALTPNKVMAREETWTIWIQALRQSIDLTTHFFDILAKIPTTPLEKVGTGVAAAVQADLLKSVLDLMVSMVQRKDEKLAATGQICLHQFLHSNIASFQRVGVWKVVTDAIVRSFIVTLPAELLNCEFGPKSKSAIELGDLTDEIDENELDVVPQQVQDLTIRRGLQAATRALSQLNELTRQSQQLSSSPVETTFRTFSTTLTLDDLEFEHTIIKCGTHLELIQTILDVALLPTTPESEELTEVRPPSRSESPNRARSTSDPTHQSRVLLQPPISQPKLAVAITAMADTERSRWLEIVYDSYAVARAFNSNYELRYAIWKKGLVEHMPNLVKQETIALATYVRLLFAVYRDGDNRVVKALVRETVDVLERYLEFIGDQQKNQRDLALWSPVVVMVLKELCATPVCWDVGWEGLRKFMPRYFRLAVGITGVDRSEVRVVVQEFLRKIGDSFVKI
ncbi:Brefeldin A-inhibited guanine nucleotide-exchange protein 1, partial [Nowakowskiella sp. JEL0078]